MPESKSPKTSSELRARSELKKLRADVRWLNEEVKRLTDERNRAEGRLKAIKEALGIAV